MNEPQTNERAAYTVVCVKLSDGLGEWQPDMADENLRRYGELAHVAIEETGTTIVKLTPLEMATVVKGEWPGNQLMIQRFTSLEQLRTFWTSKSYGEAIAARRKSPLNPILFALGFEGRPPSELSDNDPSRSWSLSIFDGASTIDASSPTAVAVAKPAEVFVAEGENPFPDKTLVIQFHESTEAAVAAAPAQAAVHLVTSGGMDK